MPARLGGLTPGAGHLVHMPGHTWYRVGMFEEALDANVVAVAVDEAYLASAGEAASATYRYGYYPHNLHFVMTSAQMAGAGDTALAMAERLDAALPMEMADMEGWNPVREVRALDRAAPVRRDRRRSRRCWPSRSPRPTCR